MGSIEITAGPCAVQSRSQMKTVVAWAQNNGVPVVRGCHLKPRTFPGDFLGVGIEEGMAIVQETFVGTNLIHATEVITPQDVALMARILKQSPDLRQRCWIGAKTGPSNVLGAIAQEIHDLMPETTELYVKNQMERDKKAWLGRIAWVLTALPPERVGIIMRGFSPTTETQRNQEDLPMTAEVKQETNLVTIFDPSHVAGIDPDNVIRVTRKAIDFHNRHFDKTGEQLFDGFQIEVSPNPSEALSDRDQQLSLIQASALIAEICAKIQIGEAV